MANNRQNFFRGGYDSSPYDEDEKRRKDEEALLSLVQPQRAPTAQMPTSQKVDSARRFAPEPTVRDDEVRLPDNMQPREEGIDVGDAITNFAIPGVAALVDAFTNKGRSIGAITQAAATQANQRAISRKETARDQLDYLVKEGELKERGKYNDYLNRSLMDRSERGSRGLDNASDREKRLREADSRVNDPNSDAAKAFRAYAVKNGAPEEDLVALGLSGMKMALPNISKQWELQRAPQENAVAADRAGQTAAAGERARTAVELQTAPEVNANAAAKAGLVSEATEGSRVRVAQGSAAARKVGERAGEEQVGTGTEIPGFIVRNPRAAAQNLGDDTTKRKVQDITSGSKTAYDALREMRAIREEFGTELVGNAKSRYDMAGAAFNTGMTQIGSTGTLTDGERKYYSEMVPGLGAGWTDALRVGGKDIKLEQLNGALSQFGKMADSKLSTYGGSLDRGDLSARKLGPNGGAGGVSQANGNAPMSGGNEGPPPPAPGQGGATRMRSTKTGAVKMVPAAMVEQATVSGWVAM